MKIEISNIKENKSISLLAEIIKIGQEDNEALIKEVCALKNNAETLNKRKEELEGKVDTLSKSKEELEGKVDTLSKSKEELEGKVDTLSKSKEELEGKVDTLSKSKEELEGKVDTLSKSKEELEGKVDTLSKSKEELESKMEERNTELAEESNSFKGVILRDKLIVFKMLLGCNLKTIREEKWIEFIDIINAGILETLSITDVNKALFKIQGKNGWLTKLASLYWWSNESHVAGSIPHCFDKDSFFCEYFKNFLEYLASQDILINLPVGDFSNEINSYNPDYDEKELWVKELFPHYKPNDFVLCEINFLSINTNQGKCTGFNI